MRECESTRGKWSTPERVNYCPDCGEPMPLDKPIRSWMAERNHDETHVNVTHGDKFVFRIRQKVAA